MKVKFKSPYAPFLDSVAQPFLSIVSPTAAEKFGKDIAMNPTGTGPFKFESYQIDNVVRIVKNPDYNWAPSMFKHQGPPYIDAINWRIIADPATRVAALKSGEVQFIDDLPVSNYAGDQDEQRLRDHRGHHGRLRLLVHDERHQAARPTTSRSGRRSPGRSTATASSRRSGTACSEPACSVLTSVTFGYDPATCQVYSYDPKKAAALLDEAGWKMEGDVRKKNGEELVDQAALPLRQPAQRRTGHLPPGVARADRHQGRAERAGAGRLLRRGHGAATTTCSRGGGRPPTRTWCASTTTRRTPTAERTAAATRTPRWTR